MAAEIGDIVEFVVENALLSKLMFEDDTIAIEDEEERKLGVSVDEIYPEQGQKLRVRATIAWIEEPEV